MQLFRTYNVWLINWSFDGKKETRKDLIFGFMKPLFRLKFAS